MKAIKVNTAVERKLVAVITKHGFLYVPDDRGATSSISSPAGLMFRSGYSSLEKAVDNEPGCTPVYEGDTVTLQF